MAKVYMVFMIEPEDKAAMIDIATMDTRPGEKVIISISYREAVRDYLEKRSKELQDWRDKGVNDE